MYQTDYHSWSGITLNAKISSSVKLNKSKLKGLASKSPYIEAVKFGQYFKKAEIFTAVLKISIFSLVSSTFFANLC